MFTIVAAVQSCYLVLKWLLLLILPFTIIPIMHGVLDGTIFAIWASRQVGINTLAFTENMNTAAKEWNVDSGSPLCNRSEDINNEFGIMRINSNDWNGKLNYYLPNEIIRSADAPINQLASFDALMASTTRPKGLKDQWVYITSRGWKDLILDPWDEAFARIIKQSYLNGQTDNRRYFMAQYHGTASFLCGVWGVKNPALLHFRVVDKPVDPQILLNKRHTYSAPTSSLRGVEARLVEFPLKSDDMNLVGNTFPGYEEQIRYVLFGDGVIEQFEPYGQKIAVRQALKRFNEYLRELEAEKGSLVSVFTKTEEWLLDNIGKPLWIRGLLESVGGVAFGISALVSTCILFIGKFFFPSFLFGYPGAGEATDRCCRVPEPHQFRTHVLKKLGLNV